MIVARLCVLHQQKCLLAIISHPNHLIRCLSTKTNSKNVDQPNTNEKLVKVAIIGVPNAGKSTFINNFINHRVCPTSSKVHTTRNWSKAVTVRQNSQIVVFDTPGLVTPQEMKKHRLDSSFVSSSRHSIQNADLIGVVHDVSNAWTRNALSPIILDLLQTYSKIPSFLILNKIDTLKSKRVLLDVIKLLTEDSLGQKSRKAKAIKVLSAEDTYVASNDVESPKSVKVGWAHFGDVFMVSSLTGDGLSKVMDYVLTHSRASQWEFAADQYTDRKPEDIIVQSVQARLLDYLPQEIPYQLTCEIEYYSVEGGIVYASVLVTCPNNRLERLMCGVSNGKLKQINERVTSDLVETFKAPVHLTITSVVPKKAQN